MPRSRSSLVGLSLALLMGVAGPAWGQDADPPGKAIGGDNAYEGVVPGETESKPPGAPWRSKRWAPVYWVGFQPRDAGQTRVFVQLGREVEVEQRVEAGRLIVFLPRARLANRNARRPLVTRFFDSAVAEIDARGVSRRRGKDPRPAGVELRIEFQNPADAGRAQSELRREEDGYSYLYLDFGPRS